MAILVTGGTGFIGSYLVKELLGRGEDVVVYDLFPNTDLIREVADRVELVRGDILDSVELLRTIKSHGVEDIFHLAYLLIADSREKPSLALRVNCEGLNNMFEVARIADTGKVVWASSTGVYGPAKYYTGPVDEDTPTKPTTVYGACKVLNEFMGSYYFETYGLDNIALRPTVVYGAGRKRGGFTFANDLVEYPALGKPTKVPFGDQEIDWQYVKDVVKAFILAYRTKNPEHRVFNVGGEVHTVRQAADCVRKFIPNAIIEVESGELGWVSRYDTTRAREELGYEPSYTLERGVEDQIKTIRAMKT